MTQLEIQLARANAKAAYLMGDIDRETYIRLLREIQEKEEKTWPVLVRKQAI